MIKCVMLIDDNKLDLFFHERVLRKSCPNLTIITYTSPKEALSHLLNIGSTSQPELVFLDLNMPEMTGWEFLDNYQKLQKDSNIKFVVMSGLLPQLKHNNFKNLVDFTTKPLTCVYIDKLLYKKDNSSTKNRSS